MDFNIFTLIGELTILILIILLVLILITLILGAYLIKKEKLIFPGVLLFTLNLTYPAIKYLLKALQFNDLLIDQISIDLRNKMNMKKFKELEGKDVIIVLPHCLRAPSCPAILGSSGLECVECGQCCIGSVKKVSKKKDIDIYIVPGSSFIKNILKKRQFKGVIGVACPVDLNVSMMALSGFVTEGVYLLNDGCINTMVNVDEIIELIDLTKPVTNYRAEITD